MNETGLGFQEWGGLEGTYLIWVTAVEKGERTVGLNSVVRPREMLIRSETALPSIKTPLVDGPGTERPGVQGKHAGRVLKGRYGHNILGSGGKGWIGVSITTVAVRELSCSLPNEEQATTTPFTYLIRPSDISRKRLGLLKTRIGIFRRWLWGVV